MPDWDKGQERAETARKLYEDVLEFETHVFDELDLKSIIEKLEELVKISDDFNQDNKSEGTLVISITWIGQVLYFDKDNFHRSLRDYILTDDDGDDIEGAEPPEGEDGSTYFEWFAVTTNCEPFSLLEYADKVAANERTHVISFHDYQSNIVTLIAD